MNPLILASAVLAPTILFAQGQFDGTWKTISDQSKFSSKPLTFSLKHGMYDSTGAGVKVQIKADGRDQPVSGLPWDTFAVKEVDAHTLKLGAKKNGKVVYEQTRTASADGKTLNMQNTVHSPDSDQTTASEWNLDRVGERPPGAHATSGSWQLQKVSMAENDLLETYRSGGDGLTWSNRTGESWTAKFDGKDYPVKGNFGHDSVSLEQVNDRTIKESFKREGKLSLVNTITVSPDGKKMTTVEEDKAMNGRVSTFVAEKQ